MRFKETDAAISGSAVISFISMLERIWESANGTNGTTFVSARDTPPLLHATCLPRAEMFMRNWAFSQADRMKVKELRPESKVDVIDLTIRQKGAVRDFSSRGGSTGKGCDAKAVDEEGSEVSVRLWNEEIERVQANDRIRITNGWVREWRGKKQGRAGRDGKAQVLREGRRRGEEDERGQDRERHDEQQQIGGQLSVRLGLHDPRGPRRRD